MLAQDTQEKADSVMAQGRGRRCCPFQSPCHRFSHCLGHQTQAPPGTNILKPPVTPSSQSEWHRVGGLELSEPSFQSREGLATGAMWRSAGFSGATL